MKKIIKYFSIILFIIILSGCSIKENLQIENTGYANETFRVSENNEILIETDMAITDNVEQQFNSYKSQLNDDDYNYNTFSEEYESGVEIRKTYDTTCEYFENSVFINKLFDSVDCIETDDYIEINSNSNLLVNGTKSDNYVLDLTDNVTFEIDTTLPVEIQDADSVKDNVYTWEYNKHETTKSFHLKVNKNFTFDTKKDSNNKILFIVIILLIMTVLIGFVFYRKYKKNKINY